MWTRTGGGCAPRSAPIPSGSHSTGRFTRRSCTAPSRARAASPATACGPRSPICRVLALTADCVPIALARVGGDRPGVAVLHVGWRGLLAGIVAQGAKALGGRLHAAIGPAIGPCCYEVGAEVSEPFAAAFGPDVLRGRNLDLWSAAERALREAGVEEVERVDLCTHCNPELFFSHRRTGLPRGGQGVIARVA